MKKIIGLLFGVLLATSSAYAMPEWLELGGGANGSGADEIPIGSTVEGDSGDGTDGGAEPPSLEGVNGNASGE